MNDIKEKVNLNIEEAQMVAGGFSLSATNLASLAVPSIAVYKQCGCNISASLKPVAAINFGSVHL